MEDLFSMGRTASSSLPKVLLGINGNIINKVEEAIHRASLLFIDV